MPYTTGLITNTRATGTAASNVVVSVRNTSNANAMIIVEVFGVPYSTLALTPLYVTGYYVPAMSSDIREFFIAGNVAYEVQIDTSFPLANVVCSVYGLDEFGNLVTDQRVLQSELTQISALSIPV
ncbi:hypothetical protein M2444_006235 [Paenibacillus sp. PastF-3]|jgi:hypothetical protein|uniref:hypothetical protein n=1 Tax=unclassified Paenibacillus TaxID=185978 RepID=UPI002474D2E0|nr:hypothetical protein [Paenibacillus sp. PastF-3]MDH6374385.1 hypothetical protein [Paenibacillus sp. PastF-3]